MNPMAIFWLIRIGIALAGVGAIGGGIAWYSHHEREIGRDEVRAERNVERLEQERIAHAADAEQRRIEQRRQSLQAEADERKNHAIRDLERSLAGAVSELRNRPERPAAIASATGSNPQAAQACTGAELYRPDAEFLAREAARAQRILIERDDLWEKYNALTVKP